MAKIYCAQHENEGIEVSAVRAWHVNVSGDVTALPPQTENPHVRSALRIRPQAVFPANSIADRQHHQIGIKSCRSFDHLVGARQEAAVLKNFQARIPYGLVVPDVDTAQ